MEFIFDMEENKEKIDEFSLFLNGLRTKKGGLMSALHEAQSKFGYLPVEIQELISKKLNIPLSEIYGVATFYSQFSLIPKGDNIISLCLGTACYVRGAQDILNEIKDLLGIEVGQTTPDGKFSIEDTRCLGACGLAPVMVINEDVYGKLKKGEVEKIIEQYK